MSVLYMPVIAMLVVSMQVVGFGDFCHEGRCFDNPAADIARNLGGQVVAADYQAVDDLVLSGPVLALGLDWAAEEAYTNGTAFGQVSRAVTGPDAGDYLCGYLYAKLLEVNPCAAFVHVPLAPTQEDLQVVLSAAEAMRDCYSQQQRTAAGSVRLAHRSWHAPQQPAPRGFLSGTRTPHARPPHQGQRPL